MSLPIDLTDKTAAAMTERLSPIVASSGGSGPFDTVVPQGAIFPRLVFSIEADTQDNTTPQGAVDYLVSAKAISTIGFKQANILDGQMQAALHNIPLEIDGVVVYSQMRVNGTPRLSNPREGDGYYYQAGGVYRIRMVEEKP